MNTEMIRRAFSFAYKGQVNFMTPYFEGSGTTGSYIYEISSGRGMMPFSRIYGVTVLTLVGQKKRPDLSAGGFATLEEAREYARSLPEDDAP